MLTAIISIFAFGSPVFANDTFMYCNLKSQPNESELRISMGEFEASALALRSPNETEFRVQDMTINNVIGTFQTDDHSFIAKPNITSDMIDWSQTSSCFIEVGTQWYFNFNYAVNTYFVQLSPYFVKKTQQCITPRFPLQTKELNCDL